MAIVNIHIISVVVFTILHKWHTTKQFYQINCTLPSLLDEFSPCTRNRYKLCPFWQEVLCHFDALLSCCPNYHIIGLLISHCVKSAVIMWILIDLNERSERGEPLWDTMEERLCKHLSRTVCRFGNFQSHFLLLWTNEIWYACIWCTLATELFN